MYTTVTTFCIGQDRSIRDAITQMDQNKLGIVLIVDTDRRLVGTVTDGDIRRAVLERLDLDDSVEVVLARKAHSQFAQPITAPIQADEQTWLRLLKEHNILHLPLLDEERRVVGMVTLDDFLPNQRLPLHAVVMAGGFGSRLHPLTKMLPKSMLPIGDQPLLEIIVRQLREAGIKHVKVTTHHQAEKIAEHFGDGRDFGVELSYVAEDRPLGTVGGLGLMTPPTETTLVMNGDILTQVDFRAMLVYHREHKADLTMAVRQYDLKVPYGVVECEGLAVRSLSEKPTVGFFVNAGIYLLEPPVYQFIPNGQPFDMTDLIQCLLKTGRMVVSFPIREYWLDIGEHAGYEQAGQDVREEKVRL